VLLMLARATAALAGAVLVLGGVALVVAYPPGDAAGALRLARSYAASAWSSRPLLPDLAAAAGLLAVLAAVAGALARRALRAAPISDDDGSGHLPGEGRRQHLFRDLERLRGWMSEATGRTHVDIIRLVDELMRCSVVLGASDIHLTPTPRSVDLAYRIDGVLEPVCSLSEKLAPTILSRLRVMARLDTFEHDVPQDGRIEVHNPSGSAEFRVSVLPTSHGPKVVMRVARTGTGASSLEDLGLSPEILARFRELLRRPQGLLFLTGPTGSGKTTTIYAALRHIHESRGQVTNIVTIEDPIEFNLPFLTQTQVSEKSGLTFAMGLRAILRQDPNVIMVGEIRDPETSAIATQAGLTGHLILTTVHSDSAAGLFNRVIETGVEPFLLASASLGVLSQRLVRSLCRSCRKLAPVSPVEVERLDRCSIDVRGQRFHLPVGCAKCGGRGYLGRSAVCELLVVTSALRELLNSRVPTPEIHRLAVSEGMVTLLEDGVARARSGETSLAEVLRVAGQ
jgi:general secretion pathway protein E